nr:MAG TPA: hypothetical protein [Bacteriophage sp.]
MRYVVFGIGLRNIIISFILCFVNVLLITEEELELMFNIQEENLCFHLFYTSTKNIQKFKKLARKSLCFW